MRRRIRASALIRPAPFEPADLDGAWLVVAAATPEVNRQVAEVAETRRIFVNAVDDPANATAFLSGVVRRDGVTLAISTSGDAPALTALLREALDALLPRDLGELDVAGARRARGVAARRRADGGAQAAAAAGAERARTTDTGAQRAASPRTQQLSPVSAIAAV